MKSSDSGQKYAVTTTRWRAAAVHLSICIALAAALAALFWFVWYPSPLFVAVGGAELFAMLLAIDVILGPFLTLLVYKAGKKTLKFDLTVIALLQLAALCYGIYTLLIARPAYVAAMGFRFDVIPANEIDEKELVVAKKDLSWIGPEWVGIKFAADKKERQRVLFSSLAGIDYGHYPQHHQPIENMREEILKNAQSIPELRKLNPGEEAAIDRWIEKRGMKPDDVVFQGLKARAKDMAVIVDAKTAKVIGIAPFKPWP
jgi:hypothetical protein